jgi:hypothetical protein
LIGGNNVYSLRFEEGGLWSDLVPSSRVTHTFHNNANEVVLADQRARLGVSDFCIRMVCHIDGSSNGRKGVLLRFHILLFPAAAAELEDTPESKFPGWPGLLLCDGSIPLGPKPSTAWGCPIIPFIQPATPFAELPAAPSGERLRAAVAAVMRKAGQPDIMANGATTIAKWAVIRANPRALANNQPRTTWPAVSTPADAEGKYIPLLMHDYFALWAKNVTLTCITSSLFCLMLFKVMYCRVCCAYTLLF